MKKLNYVILKDGTQLLTNSKVQNCTFYDLQTKGKIARKCILNTLRKECINYKDVAILGFEGLEIELY